MPYALSFFLPILFGLAQGVIFILVHLILHILFPLFQGFQVLFHLLLVQLPLLWFRLVIRILVLFLFFVIFLFVFLVFLILLLLLLILLLFFHQCLNQVIPGCTVGRIETQGVFPGINAFCQFLLTDHGDPFIVIS